MQRLLADGLVDVRGRAGTFVSRIPIGLLPKAIIVCKRHDPPGDHDSDLFQQLADGYNEASGHHAVSLTCYGQRNLTANRALNAPEDMKWMKLRVPPAPLFLMYANAMGANATPQEQYDALHAL